MDWLDPCTSHVIMAEPVLCSPPNSHFIGSLFRRAIFSIVFVWFSTINSSFVVVNCIVFPVFVGPGSDKPCKRSCTHIHKVILKIILYNCCPIVTSAIDVEVVVLSS